MLNIDRYISQAVVRYLNGDMALFEYYRNIALKMLKKEKDFIAIEDMLDKETISKLYKMVN